MTDNIKKETGDLTDFEICVLLFQKAIERITSGKLEEEAAIIRERYGGVNVKKGSPFDFLVHGYLGGFEQAFDLIERMEAAAEA